SDVLLLDQAPGKRCGTREALLEADAVVAVSRDLARRVVDLGQDPGKVHVVYRGVDASRFSPGQQQEARARLGLPTRSPLLLFVGNLLPVKGLDVLLEACGRLANNAVPFTCYLAGQGPLRNSLEVQARRLGLTDRVRFLGAVSNDRLADWYRAASVFVLPSRSE